MPVNENDRKELLRAFKSRLLDDLDEGKSKDEIAEALVRIVDWVIFDCHDKLKPEEPPKYRVLKSYQFEKNALLTEDDLMRDTILPSDAFDTTETIVQDWHGNLFKVALTIEFVETSLAEECLEGVRCVHCNEIILIDEDDDEDPLTRKRHHLEAHNPNARSMGARDVESQFEEV